VQKYLISLLPFPISKSQKDTTRNVFIKSLFSAWCLWLYSGIQFLLVIEYIA